MKPENTVALADGLIVSTDGEIIRISQKMKTDDDLGWFAVQLTKQNFKDLLKFCRHFGDRL